MTPEQCRAARALLGWNQRELAERAGCSHLLVAHLETYRHVTVAVIQALRDALEQAHVEFIEDRGVARKKLKVVWVFGIPEHK